MPTGRGKQSAGCLRDCLQEAFARLGWFDATNSQARMKTRHTTTLRRNKDVTEAKRIKEAS